MQFFLIISTIFFNLLIAPLFITSQIYAEDMQLSKKSPKKEAMAFNLGNLHGKTQIKFKPESFYLKYANLLNNNNPLDKIILSRSTIDYNIDLLYGADWYGYDVYEFFTSFRNKAVWGNPESIAQTTESSLKLLEVVFGGHKHFITRHILWIREMWFKFSVNEALGLNFSNKHYFTMGSFPFELGRGIALGSAFAVGPRVLGFYSDNAIDQYAFGFKFSGDIWKNYLNYDLYGSILENKSDSFNNTAAKIRGQEFGRKFLQERGSGSVNFIVASRMRWFPVNDKASSIAFEPYILYNYAPEQKIEINADANSKLATLGLAGEFALDNLEFGFDTALNFGRQVVPGIDRNETEFANDGSGNVIIINSRVHNNSATGPKTRYVPGSATQRIINTSAESASQNGRLIGTVDGVQIFNDINRFRSPSVNKYKGWMFITDGVYKFTAGGQQLRVAAMAGVASGDKNPNQDLENPNDSNIDGDFKGFIPLQELYSGNQNRVQSVFLLGGTGKAPRPLFIPTSRQVLDRLPTVVSGFTNLIFVGSAFHWYPKYKDRSFMFRPNIIAYWQQKSTNAFDRASNMSSTMLASNYLGFEVNAFSDAQLFDECKLYLIGSVFVPGQHFKDIKGTPLTRDELKIIDQLDRTGVIEDTNPRLGDDIAYTINIGIECRF